MMISGEIIKERGRGRNLGFPTANIELTENIEDGIFVGFAQIEPNYGTGMLLACLVFVGANITFGEEKRHVEVYILDFDQNLYGNRITVEILKKIRENIKFESEQALIEQMRQDELVAREFFKSYTLSN